MNFWNFLWSLVKMLYQIFCCSASLVSLLFNIFWFFCNLASAGIPWLTLILVIVCIASKFVKLNSPDEKKLMNFLGARSLLGSPEDLTYWPIANKGAGYDAPENSKAAMKKCAARGYRNVFLDAGITSNGKIVVVNRLTLERAGVTGPISSHTLEELKKVNITEQHPLGSNYEAETVLTLTELMEFLSETPLNVFLHLSDNSTLMLETLKLFIKEHEEFTRHLILVTHSPYVIYQLRKVYPELICSLWTEKSLSLAILKASTLITSIYGAIFRNIIAPVIGISVVFINKEEFNLHIADLWRNVGVHPIVYTVNSPNEKRYFQKTMKTQYLTDSLRSEPHLLMKA